MIYLDPSVIFSLYGTYSNTTAALSLIRNASEPFILSITTSVGKFRRVR